MDLAQMEAIAADLGQQIADLSDRVDGVARRGHDSYAPVNNFFITKEGTTVSAGAGVVWEGTWGSIQGYLPNMAVKYNKHLYIATAEIPAATPVVLSPHTANKQFPEGTGSVASTINSAEEVEDEITAQDLKSTGIHVSNPELSRFYALSLAEKSKIKYKVSGRHEVGFNHAGNTRFEITNNKGETVASVGAEGEANPYTAEGETAELAAGNYLLQVVWYAVLNPLPNPPAPFTFELTNPNIEEIGNSKPTKDTRWERMI